MNQETLQKKNLCQRCFQFGVTIIQLCQRLEIKPGISRKLAYQLVRSGTSIGANIEEAQGAQSRADFASKYSIARKEAPETLYWLRLLGAAKVLPADRLEPLGHECRELLAILTTIIKKLKAPQDQ